MPFTPRSNLNLIGGTGVSIQGIDNPSNNSIDITISAFGGSGGPGYQGATGILGYTGATGVGSTGSTVADIILNMDGAGLALSTGLICYLFLDFNCTINQWTLSSTTIGTLIVDIWACSYAQFNAGVTHPISSDKITGSHPPTITTGVHAQSSSLSDWTTTISAGTYLAFNITQC